MESRRRSAGDLLKVVLAILLVSAWIVWVRQPSVSGPEPMEPGSGSDPGNAAGPADGAEAVSGSLDIDSPARDPKRNGTPSSGTVPFVSEGFEGWIEASEDDRSLPEAAEALLIGYRDRGDCVLARSGYIDFSGSVWSCTVVGDGWVEIRLVQELEVGRSGVHLIHMVGRKEASG